MDTFVARGRWTAKFEATVMISASDNIPFSACIKATISKGHPNTLKLSVTTCYSVVSRRVKDRAMVSSLEQISINSSMVTTPSRLTSIL